MVNIIRGGIETRGTNGVTILSLPFSNADHLNSIFQPYQHVHGTLTPSEEHSTPSREEKYMSPLYLLLSLCHHARDQLPELQCHPPSQLADATSSMPDDPSEFLDLPAEIKNKVYHLLGFNRRVIIACVQVSSTLVF